MIKATEIMTALSEGALNGAPQLKRIYFDVAPVGFLRPSLWIEAMQSSAKAANKSLVERTEKFLLTVVDVTDDYSNTDALGLLDLRDSILGIFHKGYLWVGDRALGVAAMPAGRDLDKAFVEVEFNFMDDRGIEEEPLPPMEELVLNTNNMAR